MQRQGHIEVKFTNLCIKQQQGPVPINVVSKYEVNPFTDKEVMANVLIFAEMMIDDWQTILKKENTHTFGIAKYMHMYNRRWFPAFCSCVSVALNLLFSVVWPLTNVNNINPIHSSEHK